MEPPRLREDLVDEGPRHAVVHDEEEPDALERVAEGRRRCVGRARRAGEEWPEIEEGDGRARRDAHAASFAWFSVA